VTLLSARAISKRYGGIVALDHVSLDVDAGEAVGLVGPNGAGKTTLFDCLGGVTRPDAGEISFDGRRIDSLSVHARARLGIGRTFQRVELFAGMTAREHLQASERAHRGDGRLWKDVIGRSHASRRVPVVEELLVRLGLEDVASAPIESLSLGKSRLVELGRALVQEPRLLLADEPSSGLDSREAAGLAQVLVSLRDERRCAILLVEHDLDLVRKVSERAYVLDFGKVIASGPMDEVLSDAAVRRAYLGDLE
jgi:branched-chain amino acid transport system ATP-binding protein